MLGASRKLLEAGPGPAGSPGRPLGEALGRLVAARLLAALAAVLNRARLLSPSEQVSAQPPLHTPVFPLRMTLP